MSAFFVFVCGLSQAFAAPLHYGRDQHVALQDAIQTRTLACNRRAPRSEPSNIDNANSTYVLGTIDIILSSSLAQRIGSLTYVPSADQSSHMLDVSNTTVPTQFLLRHEYGAPLVSGHPNWMPVSLRVPFNESTANSPAHCAEFQTGPGSSAPVALKPCMPGWDASSAGSQLFVYDTASSQISPYWPSLWNNTNGSSMPSSTSPIPSNASNNAQSRSSALNMAPANLHFNPSSAPARLGLGDVEDDNGVVASGGSVDESRVVTTDSAPSGMQFEDLLPTSTGIGQAGVDTSSGSSSPHTPAVLAAADDTAPSPVPSPVATPADATAPCSDGDVTCIGDQFAECAGAAWVLTTCGAGTVCRIAPEWGTPGAGVIPTCDTPEGAALRNGEGSRKK